MLRDIVKLSQLDTKFCASLFGVAPEQFYEWLSGNRPVPKFLLRELASVFGVQPMDVTGQRSRQDAVPAIWYKLHSQERSSPADLEIVGLIRKLCFNFSELQPLLGQTSDRWDQISQTVRTQIVQSASILTQARTAAEIFRREIGWEHGSGGSGQFIRPNLRNAGLVIVESPVPDSQIEGCSFRVRSDRDIACVFANSYQSTWFRRNAVILHEVCHGIFDLEGDPVSIDYRHETSDDLKEKRANLFAQECLVPRAVLTHITSKLGIKWSAITKETLARIVAECNVEPRLVLRAAFDAKLITTEQLDTYAQYECTSLLKQFTDHALTTREFLVKIPKEHHPWFFEDRFVKIGNRGILLPVGYIKAIIELLSSGRITSQRAAELAMMDHYTFQERFEKIIPQAA